MTVKKFRDLKDPVKALIAIILFFIFSAAVLGITVLPSRLARNEAFDTAVVGSSRAKWGINSEVIDEVTGMRVINLSSGPAALIGRFDILQDALSEYDLKTVIIEIAYDAFETVDVSEWSVYDSVWIVPKMVTLPTAARYIAEEAKIKVYDYDKLIGALFDEGITSWKAILTGKYHHYKKMAGSGSAWSLDWHYNDQDAKALHNQHVMHFHHNPNDLEIFRNMVQICNDASVRTIVVTTPNTESVTWYMDGWDQWRQNVLNTLAGLDYEYYDYNLYKDRQEYFLDEASFRDEMHLSGWGAESFSELFSREILLGQPSKDWEQKMFYDSYTEAKEHSRYADVE